MEKINDQNFDSKISSGYILVDFYASWCGPCRMMHPVLEELESERTNVEIMQVDVDEAPNSSKKFGVMSIPTLILFKNGLEVSKKVGFTSKEELIEWINEIKA